MLKFSSRWVFFTFPSKERKSVFLGSPMHAPPESQPEDFCDDDSALHELVFSVPASSIPRLCHCWCSRNVSKAAARVSGHAHTIPSHTRAESASRGFRTRKATRTRHRSLSMSRI